jgi:hypothetical protein
MHQMKKTNQSSKASKIGKPRGKPFEAGNTIGKGRPKGSLNKTTVALRELFSRDAVAIGEKVLTMAKEGDPMALRVVMDRIFPARRGAPAPWNMPAIKTSADLTAANLSLLEAAAKGELTPAEAQEYIPLLDSVHRVLDRDAAMKWDHESAASLRFQMGYNDDVTLERTEERRRELLKMVYAQVETRLTAQMKAQSREHSDSTPRPAPGKTI